MGVHIEKLEDGEVKISVPKTSEEEYNAEEGIVHSVAVVSADEWKALKAFKEPTDGDEG